MSHIQEQTHSLAHAKINTSEKDSSNTYTKDTKDKEHILNNLSGDFMHIRDVNIKDIFRNNLLTSQFLKDYSGISLFSDIRPEDIEDQTEKFRLLLGVEIQGDTVKKIHVRIGEQTRDIYVVSLIEHKSSVDYDVAMQLLLYMSVIWRDYAKEKNKERKEANKAKQFRYPLIFPIVYYEGTNQWTAGMHLSDRIANADLAMDCIPDFTYKVIPLRDYNNNDFQEHHNEMSLLMMINKIQGPKDWDEFKTTAQDFMDNIYKNTSPDIQDLIMKVIWGLLMKMRIPEDEAADMLRSVKEEKDMGILFENFKGIDVQAQRAELQEVKDQVAQEKARFTAEKARADAEKAKADAEKARAETEKAKADAEKARADNAESKVHHAEMNYIRLCKAEGKSRAETREYLMQVFLLKPEEAEKLLKEYRP